MKAAESLMENLELSVETIGSLADEEQRLKFIALHKSRLNLAVVIQIVDRGRELLQVDPNQSLALAEAAIDVATAVGGSLPMAHALRAKANAFHHLGNYRPAIELHHQALQLFESTGEQAEVGRTLSTSLLSLNLAGDYEQAFTSAERARAIFAELGDQMRLARLDLNLGNVFYRQDRFAEAHACYRRAYDVLLAHENREGIGVALGNLSVCLISLGDFAEAMKTYREAREFFIAHNMPRPVAQSDYNIAYLYYLRGEYSRAIDMLRSTRMECQAIPDHYHHALCNLDLSELYLELNLSAEAAELAREANAEFAKMGMGYEQAKTLAFEAIAMSQQGQAFQALKVFAKSRAIFVTEKNQVWPSLIDLYQALVLCNEGRHFEARRLARAALEFFDSSSLHGKAVLCRLLLARIAQRTADLPDAQHQCSHALEKLAQHSTPVLKHQAYLLMGHIHSAAGRQKQAYECFRASRDALETLRSNLRGQELKLSFLKNRLEVYEQLVDACLKENPSEELAREAFGYIEEAKSRTLMDQMLQPISAADGAGQSELVRKMRNLRDELNWYYSLIEVEQLRPEQRSPEHIQRLEEQARAREGDLVRVLQEASLAEAGEAGMHVSESVSVDDIRNAISPDTMVVEFFQTGDRIVVCLLNRDRLEILPVTLASRIGSVLRLLQFQLSKFRLGTEYAQAFRNSLIQSTNTHLKGLYDELLAPIRDRLDATHLLFVPHGALHYVPFHALFDGEKYLIDEHTVSYAPSASIYKVCAEKQANTAGPSLIMGVPDEKAPSILDELRSLSGILPHPNLYIGRAASEYVLKTAGRSSRFVHIATHGYFRQDSPMFSSIRLGNSYLSLYDLYQLRLPAELVTFSGCATGLNVVAAGDELIGLARGLFQAGAQSLLLSLWDVHDQSTAEFMKAFYSAIQAGENKASATKLAMLAIREQYPHPYQWAPFVLMGKYADVELR